MRKFEKKMSKKLQKTVSDVFCRIKSQTSNLQISSTTTRILNGCRRSKSIPLYANSHRLRRRKSNLSDRSESGTAAATLEDIDRFMFENFRSLYCENYDSDLEDEEDSSDGSFETPDLTLGDSRRFLISSSSSPRTSRAQSDDAGQICSTITSRSGAASACLKPDLAKQSLPSEDCIAVLKATADPVEDYRRSMGEVMAARERHGEVVDWGFMEELLFSYLRMNEKKHYRFVLDAFVDSVVDFRRSSGDGGGSGGGVTEEEVALKDDDDLI